MPAAPIFVLSTRFHLLFLTFLLLCCPRHNSLAQSLFCWWVNPSKLEMQCCTHWIDLSIANRLHQLHLKLHEILVNVPGVYMKKSTSTCRLSVFLWHIKIRALYASMNLLNKQNLFCWEWVCMVVWKASFTSSKEKGTGDSWENCCRIWQETLEKGRADEDKGNRQHEGNTDLNKIRGK